MVSLSFGKGLAGLLSEIPWDEDNCLELYRLTRRKYAGVDPFDGEGSFRFGGRWSSVGTRVCYTSTHRSLAILEYRVNLVPSLLPSDLVMATILIADDAAIADVSSLPDDWQEYPAPLSLRSIGDAFIVASKTPLMRVPSVIVPQEYNVMLNPAHPAIAAAQRLPELQPFLFDARIL